MRDLQFRYGTRDVVLKILTFISVKVKNSTRRRERFGKDDACEAAYAVL